jgi:hypothetical protein
VRGEGAGEGRWPYTNLWYTTAMCDGADNDLLDPLGSLLGAIEGFVAAPEGERSPRRALRVPSGAARTALRVRDGGCVWPGCDRPSSWTNAHHVLHWAHGGDTDLENLVLLCHRHHWSVHEGGWRLVTADKRRVLAIPPSSAYRPSARAPDTAGVV